jgi:hypothetical protein
VVLFIAEILIVPSYNDLRPIAQPPPTACFELVSHLQGLELKVLPSVYTNR